LFRKKKKHPEIEWKFNKARQNWLVRHVWDPAVLPDKDFKNVRKYLKTTQGAVRKELIEQCNAVVSNDVSEPARARRAKKLLKSLKKPRPS